VTDRIRNLDSLPRHKDLHHWADYIELICLLDPDRMTSPGQVLDRIREGRDAGDATPASLEGDGVTQEDVDRSLFAEQEDGVYEDSELEDDPTDPENVWDEVAEIEENGSSSDAERRDALFRVVSDAFDRLYWRQSAFGDAWPFELRKNRILVARTETPARRNYTFFLLCSSLRYVSKSDAATLTTSFERVCSVAFARAYVGWEVHLFGTSAPTGSRYSGQLFPRLELLAKDLRCRLKVDENEFEVPDNGDNGLDVVAWLPLAAAGKGLPVAFAQCASGATDWVKKQWEASEDHWSATLDLEMPISNWTMIPFCYHSLGNVWENKRKVNKGILADRLRLMGLLENDLNTPLPDLPDDLLRDVGF
jgi:hypothetical protein